MRRPRGQTFANFFQPYKNTPNRQQCACLQKLQKSSTSLHPNAYERGTQMRQIDRQKEIQIDRYTDQTDRQIAFNQVSRETKVITRHLTINNGDICTFIHFPTIYVNFLHFKTYSLILQPLLLLGEDNASFLIQALIS